LGASRTGDCLTQREQTPADRIGHWRGSKSYASGEKANQTKKVGRKEEKAGKPTRILGEERDRAGAVGHGYGGSVRISRNEDFPKLKRTNNRAEFQDRKKNSKEH